MKLIRTSKEGFVFQLAEREKQMLLQVLKLYPRVPSGHHALTKGEELPDQEATQRLLDEALKEERAENKRRLEGFLAEVRRWTEHQGQWWFRVSSAEVEWLLQVLNDIRVGSWVLLGSPEQWYEKITAETAPHLWAMELAGAFQMSFLHAVEGGPLRPDS